jgi:hypothetical protein
MVNVAELRSKLMVLGMSEEDVDKIKGKANLMSTLSELTEVDEIPDVEDLEVEEEEDVVPMMAWTNEWKEYVLSRIDEEDKIDGMPRVDSLMHLAEEIQGNLSMETQIPQCPHPDNERRATAIVTLTNSEGLRISGSSDVYAGNTPSFANHPVAVAETRALGRALKKMLKLKNFYVAEEASQSESVFDDPFQSKDNISQHQLTAMETMGKDKLDANVENIVKNLFPECVRIKDLTLENGALILKTMSGYQKGIPEELKGYKANWKEVLGV